MKREKSISFYVENRENIFKKNLIGLISCSHFALIVGAIHVTQTHAEKFLWLEKFHRTFYLNEKFFNYIPLISPLDLKWKLVENILSLPLYQLILNPNSKFCAGRGILEVNNLNDAPIFQLTFIF